MAKESLRQIGRAEVAEHKRPGDLWLIVGDLVVDVSAFRDEHPGGPRVFDSHAGGDATRVFREIKHSAEAKETLAGLAVGVLPPEERDQKNKCSLC